MKVGRRDGKKQSKVIDLVEYDGIYDGTSEVTLRPIEPPPSENPKVWVPIMIKALEKFRQRPDTGKCQQLIAARANTNEMFLSVCIALAFECVCVCVCACFFSHVFFLSFPW